MRKASSAFFRRLHRDETRNMTGAGIGLALCRRDRREPRRHNSAGQQLCRWRALRHPVAGLGAIADRVASEAIRPPLAAARPRLDMSASRSGLSSSPICSRMTGPSLGGSAIVAVGQVDRAQPGFHTHPRSSQGRRSPARRETRVSWRDAAIPRRCPERSKRCRRNRKNRASKGMPWKGSRARDAIPVQRLAWIQALWRFRKRAF
jgi:hypothetical protein